MSRFRYLDRNKISSLPKSAGVYIFKKGKEILYIGKASNLRERVKNHFQQPGFKDNLFISEVTKIGYIKTGSEIEALILEAKLIKKYQPKFNVLWRDDKNYFYVGITKEDFPRVFITHQPQKIRNSKHEIRNKFEFSNSPNSKPVWNIGISNLEFVSDLEFRISDLTCVGPFVDGKALKQTLKILRKVFPYRTCRKIPKRPCLWYQLGRCPGPCTLSNKLATQLPKLKEKIKKESQSNIRNLIKILKGKKIQLLKDLRNQMKKFSKSREYEKAAKIRDQIKALENILQHANIFLSAESSVITQPWLSYYDNWKKIEKELKKILEIKRKILRIEGYDVSNIQGNLATGSMVVFENGIPNKKEYRKFRIRYANSARSAKASRNAKTHMRIEKPDDIAMLKEVLTRRLKYPEWEYPQIMLIDGGQAQFNAANLTIRQFNNLTIKIVALAKKKNELFIDSEKKPILLKDLPQEISNLILRIRDEAHRFAITYHRKLRRKNLIGDGKSDN